MFYRINISSSLNRFSVDLHESIFLSAERVEIRVLVRPTFAHGTLESNTVFVIVELNAQLVMEGYPILFHSEIAVTTEIKLASLLENEPIVT